MVFANPVTYDNNVYLRLLTIVLPYRCKACKYLFYSFHLVEAPFLEYAYSENYIVPMCMYTKFEIKLQQYL